MNTYDEIYSVVSLSSVRMFKISIQSNMVLVKVISGDISEHANLDIDMKRNGFLPICENIEKYTDADEYTSTHCFTKRMKIM